MKVVASIAVVIIGAAATFRFGLAITTAEDNLNKLLATMRAEITEHESRLKNLEAKLPRLPSVHMKTTYYGEDFNGKQMANGKIFNKYGRTVAHRTLPFGTALLLEYEGRCAVGIVADRGPALWTGNELDVSENLARVLGMHTVGVASVRVTRLN